MEQYKKLCSVQYNICSVNDTAAIRTHLYMQEVGTKTNTLPTRNTQNVVAERLKLLLCTWKLPRSNFCPETGDLDRSLS
jgi:hypothetical protein